MPTYEYACTACGHEFERFESITAAPNKTCEKCKKKKAERRISAGGGFLFKGSGFYVTDYKKSGGGAKTESKPESKPCSAEAAKTCESPSCEAKPAAKGKSTKVA